jgi:phosphohistidine phosphatase SixA
MPGRLLFLAVLFCHAAAFAQPAGMPNPQFELKGNALLQALKAGGYTLYFRHAVRDTRFSEGEKMVMADCRTQIPLAESGRAQSRSIGAAMRALGIPLGEVIASPYCRTMETAKIIAGHVRADNAVAGRDPDDPAATTPDFTRLIEIASTAPAPAPGSNRLIVGHHNGFFEGLAGAPGLLEGEAAIFRAIDKRRILVARLRAEDWQTYAAPANATPPALRSSAADALLELHGQPLAWALRAGGYTLYIRSAGSTALPQNQTPVVPADCGPQDKLTEAGVAQARRIGNAMATLLLKVDEVFAGPRCPAIEAAGILTARLPDQIVLLNEGGVSSRASGPSLEKLLATSTPGFAVRVIVGAGDDFVTAAGGPTPEDGETIVLRANDAGGWVILARIPGLAWSGILTAAGFTAR